MSERTKPYEEKMKKTVAAYTEELSLIRAGRANPHLLDKIKVDYYGTPCTLQQVANVSVPEARIIQIQPWESSLIKAIEKEINAANIGVAPNNDGKIIRLVFPELTEERRKDLVKGMRKQEEAHKVALRNIRRDANDTFKKMKKSDELTEDDVADLEDEMQKLIDKYTKEIEKLTENKTKELMTV